MKKYYLAIGIILCSLSTLTFAANEPELNVKISAIKNNNPYYLCIYGMGCLNMRTTTQKNFPMEEGTLANINKFVITDMSNRKMYTQTNVTSCSATAKPGQQVTIQGKLIVKNNVPQIENLHCVYTNKTVA